MSQNRGGDSLARGMAKFTFQPSGANVSQEKWDAIWATDETEKRSSHADAKPAGDAGVSARKAKKRS